MEFPLPSPIACNAILRSESRKLTSLIGAGESIADTLSAEFGPFLCGSCIFEPIHHIIDIERFPATPRIQRIQLQHIRLNLLP